VAEQKRRNAGAEPISRHPLFPAIVALWCGALFGVASITISPSVIEHAVSAAGIDRVIPMAAPPLGTTTRILLALAMTGLGAVVGALVGRRLARPAAVHERSRQVAHVPGESPEAAEAELAESADEAPAAVPAEPAKAGRIPGRRRALALSTENDLSSYDDHAPIPGPAAVAPVQAPAPQSLDAQILNVADFDLDGFEDADRPEPAFRPHLSAPELAEAEDIADLPAWLDAESAWHEPAPEQAAEHRAPGAFAYPAPPGAQVFQRVLEAQLEEAQLERAGLEETPLEEASAGDDTVQPPFIGNRLFETYSREINERTEPGFKLLPRLHAGGSTEEAAPEVVSEVAETAEPEAWFEAEPEAPAESPAVSAPEPAVSRRIAEADLDELSHVELLERLAMAMAERREQARLAAEAEAVRAATPIAVEFAPLREVPPASAPVFERLAPAPFAAPAPFITPVIDSEVAAEETIETPVMPLAEAEPEAEPEAAAEFEPAPEPAPEPAFIPAALRPVAFDHYDDDHADDDALPGYVPPRHIGLTSIDTSYDDGAYARPDPHAVQTAFDTSFEAPFPASPFPASPFTADEQAEDDEDGVLDQGYSSLLNLSRHAAPRHHFAPVDEAEDDIDAEPHADLIAGETREAVPFARPVLAAAPFGEGSVSPQQAVRPEERLFDAPGQTSQESTERALRAALATLQRMSGAA